MREFIVHERNGDATVSECLWRIKCETLWTYRREHVTLYVGRECLQNYEFLDWV
jgi:hypothetical protein